MLKRQTTHIMHAGQLDSPAFCSQERTGGSSSSFPGSRRRCQGGGVRENGSLHHALLSQTIEDNAPVHLHLYSWSGLHLKPTRAQDGSTPLHGAMLSDSGECVKLLAAAGADLNARDKRVRLAQRAISYQPQSVHLSSGAAARTTKPVCLHRRKRGLRPSTSLQRTTSKKLRWRCCAPVQTHAQRTV